MEPDEKRIMLKDWDDDSKPREKMLKQGVASLTNVELLAILLRIGSVNCTVVEVAQQLLKHVNNNLNELGKLDVQQLIKFKGVGTAKAVTVLAALELGRRRNASDILDRERVTSSNVIVRIMQPLLADLPHEEFWVILLNKANRVIDKIRVSQGGIAGTVVDVKIIMRDALNKLASGIILVHNHPSGNPSPSNEDRQVTAKLKSAAALFDIVVLDHIIITDSRCFSFADEGQI